MRTQMAEVRGWSMAVRSITEQADMADAVRTFVQTVDRAVALELQAPQPQQPPRKVLPASPCFVTFLLQGVWIASQQGSELDR